MSLKIKIIHIKKVNYHQKSYSSSTTYFLTNFKKKEALSQLPREKILEQLSQSICLNAKKIIVYARLNNFLKGTYYIAVF